MGLITFCNIKMYEISDYLAIDLISIASYLYRFNSDLQTIPVSMNIWILICLLCYAWSTSGKKNSTDAYCFKFTWPGPLYTNNITNITCTSAEYKGVPCIMPIETSYNTTEMWINRPEKIDPDTNLCLLRDGYTCVKYSYIYNSAVLNSSHYCGKIIEDKTVAITSGCFYYEVDGHIIEVCACRSQPGSMPCNTAAKQTSPVLALLTGTLILVYNFFNE